jgi:cytochrome P450
MFARYEEVAFILKESRALSKDVSRLLPEKELTPFDSMMLNSDPPRHKMLRELAAPAFSPTRLAVIEAELVPFVRSLWQAVREREAGDLVADVALPVPLFVVARLLGVPLEHTEALRDWTDALLAGFDSGIDDEATKARQARGLTALLGYFEEQLESGQHPEGSVLGALTRQPPGAKSGVSRSDALGLCLLMIVAGYETTVNLIGSGLYCLLRFPEALAELQSDRACLPLAIDEMLRFESPLQRSSFRVTAEPIEIGGRRLEPGEQVSAIIGAANRDPEHFADPDRFLLRRSPNRHLAFGLGPHRCLGEKLARIEARVVLTSLLDVGVELELTETPRYRARTMLRSLESLRVRARA